MKAISEKDYLIRMIHGARESARSRDYFFDNRNRGGQAAHCVLQRTIAGRGFFERAGRVEAVPEGAMTVFTHSEESSYGYFEEDRDPYEFEWIGFTGGPAVVLIEEIQRKVGSIVRISEKSEVMRHFRRAFEFASGTRRDRFKCSAVLYELLLSILEAPKVAGAEVSLEERAYEIIREEFCSPANVKEIAARIGCSREHLTRRFAKQYGRSPAEVLRELRLERAKELLTVTPIAIAEVARYCGLPESNSFHRAFRKRFGASPAECRSMGG
ncbi:MAG: AraC family transcriptional regulator [Verrucomicrobiota bacterium]